MNFLSQNDAAEMLADAQSNERCAVLSECLKNDDLSSYSAEQRLQILFDISDTAIALAGYPIDRHLIKGNFYL
ncbi:MAG: hypothetical protein JW841_02435 [Deltaproteobacteria bacterium]|nr:hypothetical protein [Deltaproteobacteria bacterium]